MYLFKKNSLKLLKGIFIKATILKKNSLKSFLVTFIKFSDSLLNSVKHNTEVYNKKLDYDFFTIIVKVDL